MERGPSDEKGLIANLKAANSSWMANTKHGHVADEGLFCKVVMDMALCDYIGIPLSARFLYMYRKIAISAKAF